MDTTQEEIMGTQVFDHTPTHEEVLNLILANTCNVWMGSENERIFTLDLHCVKATIHAEALFEPEDAIGEGDTDVLRYRIQSLTLETA
jgi:hypothetical protein